MSQSPDPLKSANRVIVLVGGFLAISLMGYVAYQIFKYTTRTRSVENVILASSGDPNVKTTKVELGAFETIEGTPYRIAPVVTNQVSDRGYYSKGTWLFRI